MITASSAFTDANAGLVKKPVWVLEIDKRLTGGVPIDLPVPTDPGESAIELFPTAYEIDLQPEDSGAFRGSIEATATTGRIERWQSSPLGNSFDPGFIYWNGVPTPDIDPTLITKIYLEATIDFNVADGGLGIMYMAGSGDNGAFYFPLNGLAVGTNSALIASGVTAQALDFSQILFQSHNDATISSSPTDPIGIMQILGMRVIVYYSTPDEPDGDSDPPEIINDGDPTRPIRFTSRFGSGVPGAIPWIVEEAIDELSLTVDEQEGGAELGELNVTILDLENAITATFPDFTWEGKACRLKSGFLGMDYADYVTHFTGVVDKLSSAEWNNAYTFSCIDNRQALTKVIFKEATDGFPTDADHLRILNGHPLDILIVVLEEVGYPTEQIDVARIEQYRDGIFAGVQMTFNIDSPPAAKEFIEQQIMRPLGGYMWPNHLGVNTVTFFHPLTTSSLATLTTTTIAAEVPTAGQLDLTNVISFRFDKDPDGGDFKSESVNEHATSISLYGQSGQNVVESDGMRSTLQGFSIARQTARSIFLRYASKALVFDELTVIWSASIYEPGDVIALTHPEIPNRATGTRGITAKKFIVVDRTWDFVNCTTTYRVIDGTFLAGFGAYYIAPDGIDNYAGETENNQARYMFMSGSGGLYSNSDPGHILG